MKLIKIYSWISLIAVLVLIYFMYLVYTGVEEIALSLIVVSQIMVGLFLFNMLFYPIYTLIKLKKINKQGGYKDDTRSWRNSGKVY